MNPVPPPNPADTPGPSQPPPGHPPPPTGGYRPAPPMTTGAAPHGQVYSAPQAQAPRRRRGIPAWMALAGMLVVALIAGGAGGLAGVFLSDSTEQSEEPESETPAMNEPPPEAPERDPDTIAGVAQRVSPSVVHILSASPRVPSSGSGFVIADDYVVTNNHVTEEMEEGIRIEYSDGSTSDATVVGAEPEYDLAVLELDSPQDVEALDFGDSDEAIVGDEVIAIGAPLGLAGTVTQGIISAVDRPVGSAEEDGAEGSSQFYAIQTDAAINPGNSGGPLVDVRGRVIGVNSMIITMNDFMGEPQGNIGLGFAIPSTDAERVVDHIIDSGGSPETEYAALGITIDTGNPSTGAVIEDDPEAVESGGPADEAGLEPGDVIVTFDGRRVNSGQELMAMLRDYSPGDEVEVEYDRDGEQSTATVTLGSSEE